MAKVKIQGHASGTGVLTVTAPNTSTDRTITLPDSTGTLATTADVPAGISSSADATAITIGSDESVGINNSTGFGTYSGTGVKYSKGDGTFFVGRDGGQPLWLNRETSQGDLIGLATAGSTYARIGTTSNALVFKTGTGGNTERMRILEAGGLTFNGDTAAANALDDYEEGTWSPDLVGHTGSAGSHAHNLVGHYIKVGGLVWVRAYGYLTNKGSYSGNARLNGFPFAPDNATAGTLAMFPSTEVDANMRTINVTGSTTKADFMKGSRLDIAVPWSEIVTSYYLSASVVYAHT